MLWVVGALLSSYVATMGLLALLQDKLLLYPPASAAGSDAPLAVGAPLADAHGTPLGWVCEPNQGPAKATLLIFHGNAGCAHDHGPLAEAFAQRGWRVVSAEFPGYCGRAGTASVDAILRDAGQQLNRIAQRHPGPLIVGGYSFGAAVAAATVAAAHEHQIAGLLLITPWASLRALAGHHYPYLPTRLIVRRDLETIDTLSTTMQRGIPAAIVAAEHDTIIPVEQARQLALHAPAARYLELPGTGHNDWLDRLRSTDWDALAAVFDGAPDASASTGKAAANP